MKINDDGLNLIKEFEGCQLNAYKDPVGVWTIGYGHTKGVYAGQIITKAQAESYLRQDLAESEKAVEKWNPIYHWNENEFSALVSFTFNCGAGSLNNLLKNGSRTKAEIAKAILLYNKGVNGKTLPGLTRRRRAERALFIEPVKEITTAPSTEPETTSEVAQKTTDELVQEVLEGKYGNGEDRKKALGSKYEEVQSRINELLKPVVKYGYEIGKTYKVIAKNGLNIRTGPSMKYTKAGMLPYGSNVKIEDVVKRGTETWVKTESGYMCAVGRGKYIG